MKFPKIEFNSKLIGNSIFIILFILAGYFCIERIIFADASWALFKIIFFKSYFSEAGRYAAVIPQSFPLAGIWLNLSLKTVIFLYSVSYIVLYYIIYRIVAYKFKYDIIALAIPLALIMSVKYCFFWCTTETHQALAYNVLFFSFLYYSQNFEYTFKNNLKKYGIAFLILLLCFFTHPISMFTVLYILGFFTVDQKLWKKSYIYIFSGIIILIAIIKVKSTPVDSYEGDYFKNFLASFNTLKSFNSLLSVHHLKDNFLSFYFFSFLFAISTYIFYIVKKQYFKLFYAFSSTVLFGLIIITTFGLSDTHFLIEKDFMPLNLFILLPFLKDVVFENPRFNKFKLVLLSITLLFSLINISKAFPFFKNRINYLNELLAQTSKYPGSKFHFNQKYLNVANVVCTWSLANETLLLSALNGPDSAKTIYVWNDDNVFKNPQIDIKDPRLYLGVSWWPLWNDELFNKHYFNLKHIPYQPLFENIENEITKIIYVNTFDTDSIKTEESKAYSTDSIGNTYYLLQEEYSPGFNKQLSDISASKNITLSAQISVFPLEEISPKMLYLVISQERENKIIAYYISEPNDKTGFILNYWNKIKFQVTLKPEEKNDVVKIYLWNKEKKKIKIDDFIIKSN